LAAPLATPCHQVEDVINGTDVVCLAQNDALLDGLLTVFHVERSRCCGRGFLVI
jgi:hypothetical protein